MKQADRSQRIEQTLQAAFAPLRLTVRDDSAQHAGHAGAASGKGHFRVELVSAAFSGMSPLQRHRRVYTELAALLESDIHALSILAQAPGES